MKARVSRPMQGRTAAPPPHVGEGRLRVCLASPLFPPDYSGAAVRFQRYAPGLRAQGVEIEVIAAEVGAWRRDGSYTRATSRGSEPSGPSAEIPVQRVPIPDLPLQGRALSRRRKHIFERAVVARCCDASTRPDVLLWLYCPSVRALGSLAQLRREGIPMISAETMCEPSRRPPWQRWIQRAYRPLPYRFLNRVVVGTGVMRDSLRDLGVRTPTEIIPHGVDLERFRPARDRRESAALRSRMGLAAEDEVVLFVGPLNERKGVLQLAEAWDRVARSRPKAQLMLVGPEPRDDGGTSFADRLRERFEAGAGAGRVRFVGPVSDVESYLRGADLFVFPSRREGMPNAVCEALASGLPTILTPFVGLSDELGRPGIEYLLVERSPTGLAEGISTLLADEEQRRSLGAAARGWAETRLDMLGSLNRWATLCRQVAREPSGART